MAKRNVLGRGLGALMNDADLVREQISGIAEVELSKIDANPYQPRSSFDAEKLEELAGSIREIGLIQPVTLRKTAGDRFQIITGERRVRAAQLAGLVKIPAFIREAANDTMLEMALVENIQREDLNAIDISLSYQRLIDECDLTQETLSIRVGKKRSTVANYLRLLKLPALVQKGLRDKHITMGHAKALINIEDPDTQVMLFRQIVRYDYSVRKVEELVRVMAESPDLREAKKTKKQAYPERFTPVQQLLESLFPSAVRFGASEKGRGHIQISFRNEEELRQIVKILENRH